MPGQIAAIVLIVVCGISVLVAMSSAYSSLKMAQANYYEQYRFADVFVQLNRAPNSLIPRIESIPGVRTVQVRVVEDVTLSLEGLAEAVTGRLISIPEQQTPMLNDLFIRSGRYPEKEDEVLASEAFAEANRLSIDDSVSAVINGRWQTLRIVGIALSPEYVNETRGTELVPDNKRFGLFWMHRNALSNAFNMRGSFNDASLSLMRGANEPEIIAQLDQLLAIYGGLGAFGRENQVSHTFVSDSIRQLSAFAVLAPAIFLGIAAFLLNRLLSRLVGMQRDQIAVMKAFGYSNFSVGIHYLKLVTFVVMLGVILGVILGQQLGQSMMSDLADSFNFPMLRYEIRPIILLTALLISSGAATLGAFLAGWEAVSLPPAQAMRPEPPATYRPTLVEKLGLQRWFSAPSRIIWRNLERSPLRALLSVMVLAIAVAMLYVNQYFANGIHALIDIQFRTIQREDITLVFNNPLSSQSQFDLRYMPGVLRVEPFRSVPVQLRLEHLRKRSSIIGITPTSELRRLLDSDQRPVNLPSEGILLSAKLADILQAQLGDELTVEVLEGKRFNRRVLVTGIFDELVGISAYMNRYALNRLMNEGSVISGVYLKVDPQQQTQLYTQLKRMPAVASVAQRQNTIEQFNSTLTSSVARFTTLIVIFASVIVFCVVYNSARIALSERGRELATLRIIGFTRGEIALILLGEQAVLLVFAIPIGYILGFRLSVLMTQFYDWELFRFPLVITPSIYAFAFIVIMTAALISGSLICYQLNRLNLIAVLKTRE
ncbi:MAG: FtsX-like permease family protein [Cyanobacteria bacterium P01_F01_bin.116]